MKKYFTLLVMAVSFLTVTKCTPQNNLKQQITDSIKDSEIARADSFLNVSPVIVTVAHCERSAGAG